MGGKIWCLLHAPLVHHGSYGYQGNLFEHLVDWRKYQTLENSLPENDADAEGMLGRYEWVAKRLEGRRIANACSGPGYGMPILQRKGAEVVNFDRDDECERICNERGWLPFVKCDVTTQNFDGFDSLCTTETIEHLEDPIAWLRNLAPSVREIGLTCPSIPTMHKNRFHCHDFSYNEVLNIFRALGWTIVDHACQRGDVVMVHARR